MMPRMRLFPRPSTDIGFLRRQRPGRWRGRPGPFFIRGIFAGLLVVLGAWVYRFAAGDNVHEVQPGRVYRTAQMGPDRLREFIRQKHIRTVINLRGYCPDFDWYVNECRMTHEAGVSQEDVTLS